MEKLTNRVIVWLWADKRGLTFADDSHVNQEHYTKNVESVSFSHSLLTNIMRKNCAGQGGNCLRKRASDNFSSDSSHQSAEPYLTPSTWHTVDMLKNAVQNTSGSLSQSLTSKRTISDSFWTTNNNAMIAFFAVLGVFILAIGLWVSFSPHCILVKLLSDVCCIVELRSVTWCCAGIDESRMAVQAILSSKLRKQNNILDRLPTWRRPSNRI